MSTPMVLMPDRRTTGARAKTEERIFTATKLQLRSKTSPGGETLPAGVCGRMTGIALTYNVADDYGTVFVPGCLTKTRGEKVNMGKVKLFADHGPFTDTHVGVVRAMEDRGDSVVMVADLFDTEAGRSMKEYLEAVLASGADTGLSIGFRPHGEEWRSDAITGKKDMMLFYKEVELREVSITPVPAVPGTDVIGVRSDLLPRALRSILMSLPKRDAQAVFESVYESAALSDTPAVPPTTGEPLVRSENTEANAERVTESASVVMTQATEQDRLRAVREAYSPVA